MEWKQYKFDYLHIYCCLYVKFYRIHGTIIRINKLSKVAVNGLNTKISCIPKYKQAGKKTKTIQFTTASKRVKQLGMNLPTSEISGQ